MMAYPDTGTLFDWVQTHAKATPDTIALQGGFGDLTYGDLLLRVRAVCSGLAQAGIDKGDVVAVQLPNIAEFVVAFLAISARGGIMQTLHMPYRSKELSGLLTDSKAKAVILTHGEQDSRAEDAASVRAGLTHLTHIITVGRRFETGLTFDDLLATRPEDQDITAVAADDPYLLLYTSGTTASPKGVPHVYRRFLGNARLSAQELRVTGGSRILSLAPFSHLYGLFTLHLALSAGATSWLVPAFNPQTLLADLTDSRASHIFAAPAHFSPFMAQGALGADHLRDSAVVCLSGAAVPPPLARGMDDLLPNGSVIQLWGMSELQAGTFGRPDDPAETRHTTAGRAVPQTELRVVDDAGAALPPGVEGALEVRGPSVFGGYLNRPDETEKAFGQNGWFATGDLALIDAEGFMKITGRTKELINRGGIKFNPAEIEEVLSQMPAIAQCAIVPVPDPHLGERACLCVQLSGPDASLALDDVTAALAASGISKTKWPERLVALDDLPQTPTRKVMRGVLTDIVKNAKD